MNNILMRRYILFVISLFINAFGVAFITKALLGTSPITSVNYVLSMFTPLTMGQWTIIVNLLFVVLEIPMLTREDYRTDKRIILLQIPIALCFGQFIDLSMHILHILTPVTYAEKMASLIAGCFILAVGIAIEVKANVAMSSGEYIVRVISRRFHLEFGYVKLGFDISQVIIACGFSWGFLSGIFGVREGTVIAALITGPIIRLISPRLRVLDRWIKDESATPIPIRKSSGHLIITIAREFGSGGHILGEMLSKELGIPLYDKQFIHLAAQRSGMDESYIIANEQSIPSFWLKCIFAQNYESPLEHSLSSDDVLFVAESKIIQELAEKGACVIVGRCADFVLKDHPNVIRVFCYSDAKSAMQRCTEEYGISPDTADEEIRRINRARIAHYEYYTGQKWGDPHHYNLTVNTGSMPLATACGLIKDLYLRMKKEEQ